eukprot:11212027-Lingulodinium_polyedra.AAC.1
MEFARTLPNHRGANADSRRASSQRQIKTSAGQNQSSRNGIKKLVSGGRRSWGANSHCSPRRASKHQRRRGLFGEL